MKKGGLNLRQTALKSFIIRRRWQTGLVLAFTFAVFAAIFGDTAFTRAAQENTPISGLTGVASGVCGPVANTMFMEIPAYSNTNGIADPYPSNIVVGSIPGNITQVTVKLAALYHTAPKDLDFLLVGPGGQNAIIMSDAGFVNDVVNLTITLDDLALIDLPETGTITNGTYRPTNYGAGDVFPSPAPAPSGGSALSVFNGTNPNGTWSLYAFDDQQIDWGHMNGGWELNITTDECIPPTPTPTPTPTATPTPTPTQTGCNPSPISIPLGGTPVGLGNPYPSNITVSGLTGVVSSVSVTLNNLQHFTAADLDIMLVSPDGRKFIVMSDIGGVDGLNNPVTLTLSDSGATDLLNTQIPIPTGTYRPTNVGSGDTFPSTTGPYNDPAPAGSANFASVFNNANPNGTWSLYVVDDSNGAGGNMAGGWCLNITTAAPSPGQLQFSSSNYNAIAPNTVTATVSRVSGGSGAVTVNYATSNGTATGGATCGAGVDYISTSGILSFADSESTKTLTVQLCPDAAPEPNETVNLTLSNPTGGATLGTPAAATITIYTTGTFPCDITWRKVDNPHIVSGTVNIPANQTVCIEPGVIVQWTNGSKIDLLGQIIGTGASADRIMFNYANAGPNRIEVIGTLDLQFADVNVILNINAGGSFLCRNGNFGAVGRIEATSINIDSLPTRFVQIEDTVFDSSNASLNTELFAAGLTAILRNVTFRNNAFCFVGNAYIYFDNVTSQNSPITGLAFSQSEYQPLYLNNLTVTNSGDAGIYLGHGNFEIGPNVVIQNTEYPFSGKGGLVPGSQVPPTGNRNNWFEVGQPNADDSMYPAIAVPYVIDSFSDIGSLQILPGAHFKARANFHFNTESGPIRILGLPDAPIVFEPFIAGQKWDGGQFNSGGDRMEYVIFDGSQRGVIDANSANGTFYVDNSIIRNNDVAISSPTGFFQGNLFINNITAINARVRGSGKKNPNLFENNATAVFAASGALPDVRYNWWNSPTGPTNPQNPGGTGDLINGTAYFQPFRTTRPDTTDHPPVVRMPNVPHPRRATEAGNKVVLNWTASDDHQIVKQKILYSPARNARDDFYIIADNLPPTQREYELLVPATGFEVSGSPTFLRVVAIDDQGQEGWDEWYASTPSGDETGELQITSNVAGQTFRGNQRVPLTWTVTAPFQHPPPSFTCYLVIDADRELIGVGGGSNGQSFLPPMMPVISTDSARFAVVANRGLNRQKWFFSEPFAIRPDSRWPDAAPQVTLLSPAAGQEFPAGSIVPVTWTASDDEALRQFNIQVSTDAGRTWIHIAENLPPATTAYNWQTPSGAGANDVRIRVVAVDRRFQNSSDGATRVIRLTSPPNVAPSVQLTLPADGANYLIGQAIFVAANASDSDGTIQRVEFYQASNSTGISTPSFIGSDATAPYQIGWNRPSAQNYTITARAIDNRNAATTSAPVSVNVQTVPLAPLPIGLPDLSSPEDGEIFNPGANITLSAIPSPSSYSTVRIEFYNGPTLIASDNAAPYEIVWNNVPAGRYAVFAKTIASNGAEAISKPVDISVATGGAPTPTPSPTPTATPEATPTSTPAPTTTPGATATPSATPAPTATPTATPSSTPAPTATPTATPSSTPAPTATPGATPTPPAQAINLSTRMRVQTGDNVGIGGFIITGSAPKHVLLRAIGPSLTQFGVPNVLADPMLELHGPGSFVTITNDNWREDPAQESQIQATGIAPTSDLESAIDAMLPPGAYTAIVRGNDNTSGVALVEVYDLNQLVPSKLDNISTRALISTGDNIVIAGFMLGGQSGSDRVVIRGMGPSLTNAGVPNALADPTLELRDGNGALLVANNDWQDDPLQASQLTSAGLAPTNDFESGIVTNLPPGQYTALLAGRNNGTGIGLVEVYDRVTP